ncbi:MAG: hypothetical protein GY716_20890 [bacterium]|nr:hypothetical protein [bacterium]
MQLTLDLDSIEGVAVGTAAGTLNLDDLKRAVTTMWDAVDGPDLRILWDMRNARFEVDADDVFSFATFVRVAAPSVRLRTALVFSTDPEFGLGRMFEVFRAQDNAQTEVFRDMDLALAWLREPVDDAGSR